MELERPASPAQILRQHFRAFPAAAGDLTRNDIQRRAAGNWLESIGAQGLPLGFMMKLSPDTSRLWLLLPPTAGKPHLWAHQHVIGRVDRGASSWQADRGTRLKPAGCRIRDRLPRRAAPHPIPRKQY